MWNVLQGQISNPDDGSLNAADHIKTVMPRVYVPSCRSLNEFSLTSVVGCFFLGSILFTVADLRAAKGLMSPCLLWALGDSHVVNTQVQF